MRVGCAGAGKFLVATRRICKGEEILWDYPIYDDVQEEDRDMQASPMMLGGGAPSHDPAVAAAAAAAATAPPKKRKAATTTTSTASTSVSASAAAAASPSSLSSFAAVAAAEVGMVVMAQQQQQETTTTDGGDDHTIAEQTKRQRPLVAGVAGWEQAEEPAQPRATSLSFPAKMREIKKALELDPALGIPSTIKAGFELMGEVVPPPGALPVQADRLYTLLFGE